MITIKFQDKDVQLAAEELDFKDAAAVSALIEELISKGVKIDLKDSDIEGQEILSLLNFNATIDGRSYSYSVPSHEMNLNNLKLAKYQSIDVVLAGLCNALDITPYFIVKSAKGKHDKPADAVAMKELFKKLLGFGLLVGAGAASALKVKDLLNNDQPPNPNKKLR